jgi:phenylpyruvate tautomerase PptA (4-oxalocrotonate tautomerase family)
MVRYMIQVPREGLSEDREPEIAKSVVGASPESVQIAITEIDAGCFFSGGRLIECDHIFVHGYLPDGGGLAQWKVLLAKQLGADVTAAAGFEADSTWVTISEF